MTDTFKDGVASLQGPQRAVALLEMSLGGTELPQHAKALGPVPNPIKKERR